MRRITQQHLEAKVDIVNSMLGFETPVPYGTDGAICLYMAYGDTAVHQYVGPGQRDLSTLGTKREADQFLSGMIAALRTVDKR